MAVNYLYKKLAAGAETAAEIAKLETELESLQAEFKAGKVRIQVNSGDVGSQSMIEIPVKERIEWILNRLYQLDPTNYPASVAIRVTRTKAVMYQS